MRQFLDSLTPSQKRILAGAIAFASIVGGFAVAGDLPASTDASDGGVVRTEASTSTAKAVKESFQVKVGDSNSNETSSTSVSTFRSVITED